MGWRVCVADAVLGSRKNMRPTVFVVKISPTGNVTRSATTRLASGGGLPNVDSMFRGGCNTVGTYMESSMICAHNRQYQFGVY